MTGDQADIVARLKSILPSGWFPISGPNQTSPTPVLDGVLNGIANAGAWLYGLIAYARLQMRIQTSTGGWLDIAATDYFGTKVQRLDFESDAHYRIRILSGLPPVSSTRNAIASVVRKLTGYDPTFVELWVPGDCGAYGLLGGYDLFGAYSGSLPYQGFVSIKRVYTGLPWVAGYDTPLAAYDKTGGGSMWADLSMAPGYVSDSQVFAAIRAVHAFGTVVWAKFQMTVQPSPAPVPPLPPTPQPAYVGGYGRITVGPVTFALNAYDIPSAAAYA